MKATVDVPDQLYRRVKARAALDGRSIRDVTVELYERWLAGGVVDPSTDRDPDVRASAWIRDWQALGAETAERGVDPRSALDILLADRR
jgi:hypothetical protein